MQLGGTSPYRECGCLDGKYLLQITLFSTSSMNARSTISVSSACYDNFALEDMCPFCFLVLNKCILMIMITGIGGKNMRFPICYWTMYVYASNPFEFAAPYSLMPGTESAHVIVQSFHLYLGRVYIYVA